ncbi:hypothetical protein B7C62_20530 [Kitasatospora albolonga]|uniref:Signal transduction histidine kinase subgroup 3 dimerisation and phosphoacceptor domain-containing protein n=2 Tax=Kitasatosporales TaxID=85011 RepID=A0ABC8BW93_9ACTN|nr:hypothetical protein B7C62_20530 [Kitasatospora albolonga]
MAWWDRRSSPARIELYTRWMFGALVLSEVLLGVEALLEAAPHGPVAALSALIVLHALTMGVACARVLDWVLERRAYPRRLLAFVNAVTVGVVVVLAVMRGSGGLVPSQATLVLLAIVPCFGIMPLTMQSRSGRRMLLLIGVVSLLTGAVVMLASWSVLEGVVCAGVVLAGCIGTAFTCRFSTWMLTAVWKLDEARATQARLAVTEERLRFARDLHDVLGRNLSVIAMKSELAGRLGRRGSVDPALRQMDEVQQIARESQHEVREVVRGYRQADLPGELDGACGVLKSAGVDCAYVKEGSGPLPREVQVALGWVVREGATNVLRHAEATRCDITLSVADDGGRATLTMVNDGVRPAGADVPGSRFRSGTGLAGLRERLALQAGTLDAGPGPDGTFRLVADVPLAGR